MIIIDSSAVLAVLFNEPEKDTFQTIIDGADRCVMSAVNVHETGCVLRRKLGGQAVAVFRTWLTDNQIEIQPFDEEQAHTAMVAFDQYGKGLKTKAQLNLADCAAYALAKVTGAPLLFKGNDFPHTDIRSAV